MTRSILTLVPAKVAQSIADRPKADDGVGSVAPAYVARSDPKGLYRLLFGRFASVMMESRFHLSYRSAPAAAI